MIKAVVIQSPHMIVPIYMLVIKANMVSKTANVDNALISVTSVLFLDSIVSMGE